ncbi:hypothetical protein OCU04_002287 [Sclerotinia nivalis]|uniref:N-acetyltransferase domain-containing protein n=1 Tax=Sclerotinia nivalis TaxID=352851 RepID=A0A9X0AU89_9HELO|nr:hypothetical protein OCU04_002287 [Sclerotinia nivalis]
MFFQPFILRPGTLSDINQMTLINIAAYGSSPVNKYLNPHAAQYPQDQKMSVLQAITTSYLNPMVLTLVACSTGSPNIIFAYGMYTRSGNDVGAEHFLKERSWIQRLGRYISRSIFAVLSRVYNFMRPDRATSKAHNAVFSHSIKQDNERYWSPITFPRRQYRWHVNTIVVRPEYQGKGIGRLLMEYILGRARREGVPVGLSASPEGERLYRKLGFVWLGHFYTRIGGEEGGSGGGLMIWWSEGVERDGDY